MYSGLFSRSGVSLTRAIPVCRAIVPAKGLTAIGVLCTLTHKVLDTAKDGSKQDLSIFYHITLSRERMQENA